MYDSGNLVRSGYGVCGICGKRLSVSVTLDSKSGLTCGNCGFTVCWEHDKVQIKSQECPTCGASARWQSVGVQ